jgi:ubiquinol-cytochrome c reductase cytochrome b subunit
VRTLALFTTVLAILFALGGLAQINPVWLYGPYDPAQATSPAQPDWYVAWAEGALRLGPRMDIHLFGHVIPSAFFPGAALGAVTFVALYAWPFVERWLTKDHDNHQILDRPRDHPVRMAIGVYALTLLTLFVLAAADDVLAEWLHLPVSDLVWTFRILVLVAPVIAAAVSFLLARALCGVEGGFTELTRADLKAAVSGWPAKRPEPMQRNARLDVGATADHTWRWRYIESGRPDEDEFSLTGTEDYETELAASEAAKTAYPDTALTRREWTPHPPAPRGSPTARRTLTAAAIAMVILTWLIRASSRSKA